MAESNPPTYAPEPAFQQPHVGQPLPGQPNVYETVPGMPGQPLPGQVNPAYAQHGAPIIYLQVYS